jgi:hypothetical protein
VITRRACDLRVDAVACVKYRGLMEATKPGRNEIVVAPRKYPAELRECATPDDGGGSQEPGHVGGGL